MFRHTPFIPRWFMVAAALILLLPALNFLLNRSIVQGLIMQRLKADAGVDVSSLRIHLVPRISIEFSDLLVRNGRRPDALFRARHGSLSLRLLPLFKQRLTIVRVASEEPQIVIVRDGAGQWHIPFDHGRRPAPDDGRFSITWLLPDVEITGGSILLVDEYERDTRRETRVTDVTAMIDSDLLGREANCAVAGAMGDSTIRLSGALSLLGSAPSMRFEGSVQLKRLDLAPWLDAGSGSAPTVISSRRVDVTARTLILPGSTGYDVTLSEVQAQLDWLTVGGRALIQGLGGEPSYSATLSATPVSIRALLEKIPSAWMPDRMRTAVLTHEASGTVELVSATLGGRFDRPSISWKGTAKLSQGTARFGAGRTPVENLSATLFFDPLHAEAMNISGDVGALRLSNGKLVLDHLTVSPVLDLQLTATGMAHELLTLLHGFSSAAAGERALNAVTDPTGGVQLSLHIAGPLEPVPQVDLVDAEITVHDLGARIADVNLTVEHLDGTIGVKPRFIELKHLRGTVSQIHFDAQGAVEIDPATRLNDVTVELSAAGQDLTQFLRADPSMASGLTVGGSARATVHLSGPWSSLHWKGRIDLKDADIAASPAVLKRRGAAAAIEVDGTWSKGTRLTARHVALVLSAARVEGRIDVRLGDRPVFDAHARAGPLPIEKLADGFVLWPGAQGIIEASVAVKGRGGNWRSWSPSGWIDIERGALSIEGLADRVRDLSLRLQVSHNDAMIKRLSFKIGDSDVAITGFVKQWAGRPTATVMVTSSKLDVTKLVPRHTDDNDNVGDFDRIRRWARSGRADVTAVIRHARYHRLIFETLSGHVLSEGGRIVLDKVRGETLEGVLSGRIEADLRQRGRIEVEGDVTVNGLPAHQLLSVFDPDADPLRGLLSITAGMRGTIDPSIPVLGTLDSLAPLRLRLTDGHFMHGAVLPKVLKILNVPALLKGKVDLDRDGIPFRSMSATVAVKHGVVTSEDIVLDSPVIKLTGAGRFDMVADSLDMGLAVSPLGSYDDLIGKIPLFGRLFAGDRPGLSTALFQVKGSLRDPDVRYLPLESIGKGLIGYPRLAIDVLRNVLDLPQELLVPAKP